MSALQLCLQLYYIADECRRMEFTADDDKELIRYLSAKIPNAEAGGRLGNSIYQIFVVRKFKFTASGLSDILTIRLPPRNSHRPKTIHGSRGEIVINRTRSSSIRKLKILSSSTRLIRSNMESLDLRGALHFSNLVVTTNFHTKEA